MIDFFNTHLLTLTIFSPLIGVIPLLLFSKGQIRAARISVFLASLIPFALSLCLFTRFQGTGDFEFTEVIPWFKTYQIYYRIGIDGFSLPLIVLTTLLVPIVLIASWSEVEKNIRGYLFLFLLLEVGLLGVFSSLDLFLFYVFWEAQLFPMYFLIGRWGGPRKIYAAIKFVLYTMVGSLLMLAAILYLYFSSGSSFNIADLYNLFLPYRTELFLFAAFALAFMIKVPLFPFHTWLPDAHVEAPTGGSVILAGVLLKMGTYGLIRFAMPIFPNATEAFTPLLMILAVIGIVYGALVSMVQPDLKKFVAYSSVSHMGFIVLGILSLTPQGVSGATIQMVNHGISTGALFLLVGMIYRRRHTRLIKDYGGLASSMPIFTVIFLIVGFSSIALPGTNGFIGEFLILLGNFKVKPIFSIIGASGVIFAAAGMLWMIRRTFFGPLANEENKKLTDLSFREIGLMLPLLILIFWIGFGPGFLLKKMENSTKKFIDQTSVSVRIIHGEASTD